MYRISIAVFTILTVIWIGNCFLPVYSFKSGLQLWMLDVGQGESVLIREPSGKFLLFDGGPDDSVLSQLGSILPPWHTHIDIVVLSHNHLDHIRGLIPVISRYSIGEIWQSGATHSIPEYNEFNVRADMLQIPRKTVSTSKQDLPFGSSQITVIHPVSDQRNKQPKNQHDSTVVLKITHESETILLTGDLNEEHENAIVKNCKNPCNLEADILQIPHHGSISGLTPQFLSAVDPDVALIPVGIDNSFRHPRKEIIERLEKAAVPIFRTDTNGQIYCIFSAKPTCTAERKPP